VLDALIASAWADEPWRLAAWRSATHVRRTPARGRAHELAGGIVLAVAPAAESESRALPAAPPPARRITYRVPRPVGELEKWQEEFAREPQHLPQFRGPIVRVGMHAVE
jgi:hypothetical protein